MGRTVVGYRDRMLELMSGRPWAVVLEAPDARSLAAFYQQLLGWEIDDDEPDWVTLVPPDGGTAHLSFASSPEYRPPVWPAEPGQQQMMMHLDLEVTDLTAAVAEAERLGATEFAVQPQEHVRVMRDPVGHPFCLFVEA